MFFCCCFSLFSYFRNVKWTNERISETKGIDGKRKKTTSCTSSKLISIWNEWKTTENLWSRHHRAFARRSFVVSVCPCIFVSHAMYELGNFIVLHTHTHTRLVAYIKWNRVKCFIIAAYMRKPKTKQKKNKIPTTPKVNSRYKFICYANHCKKEWWRKRRSYQI